MITRGLGIALLITQGLGVSGAIAVIRYFPYCFSGKSVLAVEQGEYTVMSPYENDVNYVRNDPLARLFTETLYSPVSPQIECVAGQIEGGDKIAITSEATVEAVEKPYRTLPKAC